MTVIERAQMCLDMRPGAIEGQGGNATTWSAACLLVWGFGLEPAEALPLMRTFNKRCKPEWSEREMERMLGGVCGWGRHSQPRGYMLQGKTVEKGVVPDSEPVKRRRRPKFDLEKLKAAQAPGLPTTYAAWREWLLQRSSVDPRTLTTEAFLDGLYEPGELILIFERMWGTQGDYGRQIGKGTFRLGRHPEERATRVDGLPEKSPEGMNFLMQPVDGRWYVKRGDNRMSRRTKRSVTRWPYLLLENDKAPHELWLNCMVRARIRICAIVASGGRSLHAIVKVDKDTEEELLAEIKDPSNEEVLTMLGCDAAAMQSLVYPRLANTWREGKRVAERDGEGKPVKRNGKTVMKFQPFRHGVQKQALLYFNPSIEKGRSISECMIFDRE